MGWIHTGPTTRRSAGALVNRREREIMSTETTQLYIRALKPQHTVEQSDMIVHICFISFISILALIGILGALTAHRDCALSITRGLSPFQGQMLIRDEPTYSRASKWCAAHPDHDQQIQRAKTWPLFPPQH